MGRYGTMQFMCRREKVVPVKELVAVVREKRKRYRVSLVKGAMVVEIPVPDRKAPVRASLALNTAKHVLPESVDLAEAYAKGCPDAAAVAACDARYELFWTLEDSVELIDLWVLLQRELGARSGAIGFNCAVCEWV